MVGFINEVFIALLTFDGALATKCVLLDNEPSYVRPTIIYLKSDELYKRLCQCPFILNFDKCNGSCNTLNFLSNKKCVPNKTEDVNLKVFNMIT